MSLTLELLTEENWPLVQKIDRSDIPLSYVDDIEELWELTQYGKKHQLAGCTFAVKHEGQYVGVMLLGEALPWETDPEEMKQHNLDVVSRYALTTAKEEIPSVLMELTV